MNKIRLLLLILTLSVTSWAEKLYIPPAYQLKSDSAKQSEINRKLQIENGLTLVESGLLEPGWIDLDHPNVRFQLAYNKWIKLWNDSAKQRSIDYQEVLAFNEMVERFEKFVQRVEREREHGY